MTSIDPFTDSCSPPCTLTLLSSILLSAASIHRSGEEEEAVTEADLLPAGPIVVSQP